MLFRWIFYLFLKWYKLFHITTLDYLIIKFYLTYFYQGYPDITIKLQIYMLTRESSDHNILFLSCWIVFFSSWILSFNILFAETWNHTHTLRSYHIHIYFFVSLLDKISRHMIFKKDYFFINSTFDWPRIDHCAFFLVFIFTGYSNMLLIITRLACQTCLTILVRSFFFCFLSIVL